MDLGKNKKGELINLDFAEMIVKNNIEQKNGKKEFFGGLTTSKLRNLLEMVNNIYTKVLNSTEDGLSDAVIDNLQYLKVKFAYEAGREGSVKEFIEVTSVRDILDLVLKDGTRKKFLDYCKYFEALVAYSKFYGMGEK